MVRMETKKSWTAKVPEVRRASNNMCMAQRWPAARLYGTVQLLQERIRIFDA